MIKATSLALALFVGSLFAIGCSAPVSDSGDSESAASESDLTSSDLVGDYEPYAKDDDDQFSSVKVIRVGSKLRLEVDRYGAIDTLEPFRSSSGAYIFSSDLLKTDCDDPGCSYLESYTGVIYFKKVDGKKIPTVKFNTLVMYAHPESEGDPDGYVEGTLRWKKIETKKP